MPHEKGTIPLCAGFLEIVASELEQQRSGDAADEDVK
jgi:hypothetical protein